MKNYKERFTTLGSGIHPHPDKLLKLVMKNPKLNNMEQQYFTPKISDFRVGYEFEMRFKDNEVWKPTIFQATMDLQYLIDILGKRIGKNGGIRVPYLSKEQIEAEGWEAEIILHEDDDGNDLYSHGFSKTVNEETWYELILMDNYNLFIQKKWYRNSVGQVWRTLYYGKCPSINEFRTIIKLLSI